MTIHDTVAALLVAVIYIAINTRIREPARQQFNAVMIAGAGAAYLRGGFGWWEFGFAAVLTALAFRGLRAYHAIAAGWLLHVTWDVLHHLYGNPIVWCVPTSSAQCAVCDLVLAIWFLLGAPGLRSSSR